MADPVWGTLPKAQDDPQTIDEAIAAAIVAHEADPEAHLGVGESIEVHRTNDVLDHPAGSALADKFTMSEFTFNDQFAVLGAYSTSGDVTNDNYPGADMYVERGSVNSSMIYSVMAPVSPFISNDFDILFQVVAIWNGSFVSALSIDMGLGVEDGGSSGGFGFVYASSHMRGVVAFGATQVYTSNLTVDITDAHLYRAQYIAAEATVYFFIDGVQVATLAKPAGTWNEDGNMTLKVAVPSTNDGTLRVSNLYVSRGLLAP